MELSPNFDFLQQRFPDPAESATLAERQVYGDPRGSCFHARHALERLVIRIFKLDRSLTTPSSQNLFGYLHDSSFRELLPEAVWRKAEYIREDGNIAVHGKKTPKPETALQLVRELAHVFYWAGRTYFPKGAEHLQGYSYDESLIPTDAAGMTPSSVAQLEELKQNLDAADTDKLALETELKAVQDELEAIKAANAAIPDTHDYDEATTRRLIIDLELNRAGWDLSGPHDQEYEVTGMPNATGKGYADYVLWGDDGKPLAVVEAKKTTVNPKVGRQQAKLYANCLEQMHGQRPVIYYTNGYETHLWDDTAYPPRLVAGFSKKDELQSLILRRPTREALATTTLNKTIVERYYQHRAIGNIVEQFGKKRRKALLVMATGTGKTRMAIALVDLLQRAGWVKRALFLADRISLVNQAVGAFKKHLPQSNPVNLVTDKGQTGRVYVSTYPTMMGLIDATDDNEARFGVSHFDLVIIDEAHRSVYQKYGAIFRYFDSLLVGLTATPREQVDRNTYRLFDLEPGVPTDAYELETAVADEWLVPPKAQQVDLRFPREGIDYDELSEEEQAEWESLDWGEGGDPGRVNASAINNWLFNTDTVDKVLKHVMANGHRVEGGDRLAKTIVFARNHDHAAFIEERFNHHYPHFQGHFARVIDHQVKYPQSLIDEFSQKDKAPHIAISVDMLDTGIDVPEVANLVFFKPVYSKIKFWQMIGRGTRLCPDLLGPGEDKPDFRVFDFCFNFAFFRENPDGIQAGGAVPLGTRLFRSRVQLLGDLQAEAEHDPEHALRDSLTDGLYAEVAAMNRENFIVREQLEVVDRYQARTAWDGLAEDDLHVLQHRIAGLPCELETDEIEARLFDLTALQMQLALLQGDHGAFERKRARIAELAALLEEKSTIPAVLAQLPYLAELQESEFWEGMGVQGLEDMRLRLRGLMALLDKTERTIVYTDFQDEVVAVHPEEPVAVPKMTGPQYEKKVKEYLHAHANHLVIARLRANKPLSQSDLEGLEQALVEIGEDEGPELLKGLLARKGSPSLPHFVRSLVGLDRAAAVREFSSFLEDNDLNPNQIRFVELIIDQLTSRGVMPEEALYEAPFTSLHAGGPEGMFAGKDQVIDRIFDALKTFEDRLVPRAG